ncbi:MAG: hypothetical protein IEMM0001_0911 [bacterium]|nr:MAG: hypothetical protein IEMM0001_0911 [bacterium]
MEFLLIALILLFIPGLSITYLLGFDRYRYLLSFSLSYTVFVFSLKAVDYFDKGSQYFTYTYFLIISILSLLAFIKFLRRTYPRGSHAEVRRYGYGAYSWLAPVFIIIFFILAYFLLVGAYIELPADIFQHMESIQEVARDISRSNSNGIPLQGNLGQNGKYWFYLYSFISSWGGLRLSASILAASIFNATVFLLGVYWFSQVVFREMNLSLKTLIFISIAAVFFTFFHFGVNIFSFIRYYALAPTILNFVLYFSVMAIAIDFFREKKWDIKYPVVAGFIFYASLHIHRQEALFAILMVFIMSFYLFVQKHASNFKLLWQGQARSIRIAPVNFLTDKINISFLLSQTAMVSIFIYSYISIDRHPVLEPKIIPLENILPFFKNLYILNPTYQFYYVVTLWGAVVILLFILNVKKFSNNAFLMAGMLSPFFTVFNPFFTDLFLRYSWSLTLWRMSFLVPLELVGAYLFVTAVQYIWTGSYLKKTYGLLIAILLISLLFPFKTTFIENKYSRLLTLKSVPAENSPEQWSDLLEYLNGIEGGKRIITDPVTGYMLTALTRHISSRAKFHRIWGGFIKFNYDDYSSNPFDRYRGYLFIINKRNGGMSETGRVARHWPEGILQIENYYYSEKLEDYISSNPDRFRLMWEKDKIRVYLLDVPKS